MSNPSLLPDAEYEIMLIVWSRPAPITSMQVAAIACPENNWKSQTVLTLLGRLAQRGFLQSEKRGNELFHTPLVSRDDYLKKETGLFMEKFHKNSITGLMSALYAESSPTESELSELEQWFKERAERINPSPAKEKERSEQ